jgi:hypothetical protein
LRQQQKQQQHNLLLEAAEAAALLHCQADTCKQKKTGQMPCSQALSTLQL